MSERVLIINADDLGYDPAVSEGILTAMRQGVVSSATLIVNSPHAPDAAARVGDAAVGLHLNLARFKPLWAGFPSELL
ncbi:MAG TPA: ChbG/HpnK family deacetylase, partial [Myxococcaceae bacterium]|nr:ChbG/HpnK family deacetylase [Myxococcaceae bacterium]